MNNEIDKCKNSPYYFVTKYLKIKNDDGEMIPFKTFLNEKDFNNIIKSNESKKC